MHGTASVRLRVQSTAVLWVLAATQLVLAGGVSGQADDHLPLAGSRLHLKWGQTNSTVFVTVEVLRGPRPGCDTPELNGSPKVDRIAVSALCKENHSEGSSLVGFWDLELREDVSVNSSRVDRLGGGGLLIVLRKSIEHRWDRLLWKESEAVVSKDWKREDRNLPEEDEVELPRAQNILRLTFDQLAARATAQTVVAALRYPWCSVCDEKDTAFVKASKVVGGKAEFANIVFGTVDLREEKAVARLIWNEGSHHCSKKASCGLYVFRPDEPLSEPYRVDMHLLYEMDEYAMMADPMAGAPGHSKGQTAKPNFDRFEQDLNRLMSPALTHLEDAAGLAEFRRRWFNVVLAADVNATELRWVARRLRGVAAFAMVQDPKLLDSGLSSEKEHHAGGVLRLWSGEAGKSASPVLFNGTLDPLAMDELERFVRVHSQPLLQNYSWDLKDKIGGIGLPIAVLWVNYSDTNHSNSTDVALEAFRHICNRRRGTDPSQHVLCCIQDQGYAYYQREYGNHEPYPYPSFGVTWTLGFGQGDRFGFPFKEPRNESVHSFFSNSKRAARQMQAWLGRVLAGRVPPSHESAALPAQPKWLRGEVQEVVWSTFQQEINGSTADILLELYDNQRKKAHLAAALLRVVALTLKDYSSLKVARMEVSQNYVPPIFGRAQYSKETEYYWVPPSLAAGEWSPEPPVRYVGQGDVTAQKLLRFLKKHSLTSWSLKEALEAADDVGVEVLGQANVEQREDDRAEQEKQQMIQKMMTTLKKEKGLVDVGEMMGLKKAADTMGVEKPEKPEKPEKRSGSKQKASGQSTSGSGTWSKTTTTSAVAVSREEQDRQRQERREKLEREEARLRESEKQDKEKRRKRREEDKKRQQLKRAQEAEARAQEAKERERRRKKLEEERALLPMTPLFSWGQSREQLRISVAMPGLQPDSVNISIRHHHLSVQGRDGRKRSYVLSFELREFVVPVNSTWALRYAEENLQPLPDGVMLHLQKHFAHRWDRIAQNHSAVKPFMRKDWVQDDGELEEERDEIELPSGLNLKKVNSESLAHLVSVNTMVVAALRFPWCDKCTEKDSHYEKAARTSKDKDHLGTVVFTVLDAREEKQLAWKHNVSCSDRCELLIFKRDEPDEPYTIPGRRYAEEIHLDCYKHLLPVVSVVREKDELDRVTSAFDTAIVGFFRGERGKDSWYARFRAVARQLRGHALFGAVFGGRAPRDFGIDHDAAADAPTPRASTAAPEATSAAREPTESAESAESAESSDDGEAGRPLVLLFKPKESRHVEFTGELTLERLTHFSRVLSLPLISQYDFETRQKYQELKVPLGMLWVDGEKPEREENTHAKEVLRRLALRFSGHLVFVLLNSTRDALLMRPMGLDPRRVPTFGIASVDDLESTKFGFDTQARSREELMAFWADEERAFGLLESFCAAFLSGTLEASHESAELPATYSWHGPGAVHEVVWKTFRESVYRTEHDVLLELYSPFRPQHRTYVTVLDLVAEALAGVPTVKVARMDTANNYVLPEFGLKDKEKGSTYYFLPAAPERLRKPRRFGGRSGKAEVLPEKLLLFVHREARGRAEWDVAERVAWTAREAQRRIKRLKALEKDYEKKMQEEWMQKELEEFERYKRLGKFDNLPLA